MEADRLGKEVVSAELRRSFVAAPGNWLGDREVQSQRVLGESLKPLIAK